MRVAIVALVVAVATCAGEWRCEARRCRWRNDFRRPNPPTGCTNESLTPVTTCTFIRSIIVLLSTVLVSGQSSTGANGGAATGQDTAEAHIRTPTRLDTRTRATLTKTFHTNKI